MGTINGCGTMFYGWRHDSRDSATTKWLTLLYLPILPLSRYRLKATTAFEREKFAKSPTELAAALVGYGSQTDTYRINERTSLKLSEVATTYAKAYIALPLLILWPWLLLYLARQLFGTHPEWAEEAWFTPVVVAFAGAALMNAIVVPMWSIQAARGYKGGFFRRESAQKTLVR